MHIYNRLISFPDDGRTRQDPARVRLRVGQPRRPRGLQDDALQRVLQGRQTGKTASRREQKAA